MESKLTSVSMDFICSPKTVWDTIVTASLFEQWQSGRRAPDNLTASGELLLGSKIMSDHLHVTGVISELEPSFRFTLLFGQRSEELQLVPAAFGCRVTLQIHDPNADASDLQLFAKNTLHRLKETVYAHLPDASGTVSKILPIRKHRRLRAIISGILQGYRSPLTPTASLMDNSDHLSDIIDHTESDVIIHLRAALVAAMCTVFLMVTLSFTFRFPRVDVIPSTGMSLYESVDINKTNAFRIYIGMYKSDLELMLNCLGQQLTITEYSYVSTGRTGDNRPVCQLLISYDAYSKVRTIRFVDNVRSSHMLELHMTDLRPHLSSSMTPEQVEKIVQYELSAFIIDISGVSRVFFGMLEQYDLFFSPQSINTQYTLTTRSELTIDITPQRDIVGIEYNFPYDPFNPLPVNQWTDRLQRQYSNYLQSYRDDRAAFERIFFLFDKNQVEAETILGPPIGYTIGDDLNDTGIYPLASIGSEFDWYYLYEVGYDNIHLVNQVVFHNRWLENRSDTLLDPSQYTINEGMTLFEVYRELGVIPSYAQINNDSLVLGFGRRVVQNANANPMNSYEMCFRFHVASDRLMLSEYTLETIKTNK